MRFVLTLCLIAGIALAQKNKNKDSAEMAPAPEKKVEMEGADHMEVYRMARSYNDFSVATTALYYELAKDPTNLDLKDSLCVMYFAMGANIQAIALSDEILKSRPDNQRVLEISAVSYNNVGAVKEALTKYERLYKLSNSAYHLYQIVTIQYSLKRISECQLSIAQLINHPEAAKEKVAITIDRGSQQVPVKAAAYNVLGVMQLEAENKVAAKQSFEKALEIDANFVLAKSNLAAMNKPAGEGK